MSYTREEWKRLLDILGETTIVNRLGVPRENIKLIKMFVEGYKIVLFGFSEDSNTLSFTKSFKDYKVIKPTRLLKQKEIPAGMAKEPVNGQLVYLVNYVGTTILSYNSFYTPHRELFEKGMLFETKEDTDEVFKAFWDID
jgi:hypothetical protein